MFDLTRADNATLYRRLLALACAAGDAEQEQRLLDMQTDPGVTLDDLDIDVTFNSNAAPTDV